MRVGDIKAEALKMTGVNGGMNITYLDINGLQNDETYAAYLILMDGAINRAVDRFVSRGVLKAEEAVYVDGTTQPADEMAIPDNLARIIPYYVKGEVMANDEPDSAAYAMSMFESLLETIAENLSPAAEAVYRCEC